MLIGRCPCFTTSLIALIAPIARSSLSIYPLAPDLNASKTFSLAEFRQAGYKVLDTAYHKGVRYFDVDMNFL